MEQMKGKCVVLGVTGGIAAYKMAHVASALRKTGAEVHVVMTENATKFITPLTFESLTGQPCVTGRPPGRSPTSPWPRRPT